MSINLRALILLFALATATSALAQPRPYLGYVYPAGGQQGATFAVKLGGQGLDGVNEVLVTGKGVSARVVEYYRRVNPQEVTLLNEQLKILKPTNSAASTGMMIPRTTTTSLEMSGRRPPVKPPETPTNQTAQLLIAKIEKRISEYCARPASVALANLVFLEVTIASEADPGERELRVRTTNGVSNPMVFQVGQLPEVTRKPMLTSNFEVLGKEELALRKRPAEEVEEQITLPCIVNGQIASGEINRHRFAARRGQRLVITTQARQLIPYIADAVPGWFQPVLVLRDANGKEIAYNDDYRFKPDPTILYEIPKTGDYTFEIYDAIYRGREDFVYRVAIGELPFVTNIFPLGAQTAPPGSAGIPAGASRTAAATIQMKGWNLESAEITAPAKDAEPGIHLLAARKKGLISNWVPFALDTLPECLEKEPNDTLKRAQKVRLPIIINGRINRPNDWDVFQFTGRAGETVVAEVYARRLDSPLDSMLKLTDAAGRLLALNDDNEDLGSGLNTHHADSYLRVQLPADGVYFVHLGDTAGHGGDEYAYRLRISAPQPDFALRVVPSSISLRSKSSAPLSVYVIRRDGFTGPVKLSLKDPPPGFSASSVSISGTQEVARLTIKTSLAETPEPVNLTVMGNAKIQGRDIAHEAVPAEDRMQAFLWRHLVPASELKAVVFDPSIKPEPKRMPPARPLRPEDTNSTTSSLVDASGKPKFTKQQIAGRMRDLDLLFQEGLLTDEFYAQKVSECESAR